MRPANPILPVFILAALAGSIAAAAAQPAPRTCYSAAETREKIAAEKLAEPFPLMREQAGEHHGRGDRVRLCAAPRRSSMKSIFCGRTAG